MYVQVEKRGLCSFDNKRFLLEDNITSLAYGHRSITNRITVDEVQKPAGAVVLTHEQALEKKLRWIRRPLAATHLRLLKTIPVHKEETEEKAVEAGRAVRQHVQELVEAVSDDEDAGPHSDVSDVFDSDSVSSNEEEDDEKEEEHFNDADDEVDETAVWAGFGYSTPVVVPRVSSSPSRRRILSDDHEEEPRRKLQVLEDD